MVGEGVGSWEGDDEDFEATWAEWVAELGGYAKRFETREWLAAYLQGLLGGVERRNCWQLAEARGEAHPYGFQHSYWAVLNGMRTGCGMRRGLG